MYGIGYGVVFALALGGISWTACTSNESSSSAADERSSDQAPSPDGAESGSSDDHPSINEGRDTFAEVQTTNDSAGSNGEPDRMSASEDLGQGMPDEWADSDGLAETDIEVAPVSDSSGDDGCVGADGLLDVLRIEFPLGPWFPWGAPIVFKVVASSSVCPGWSQEVPDPKLTVASDVVLKLDANGKTWGVSPGTGLITATTEWDGQVLEARGKVFVYDPASPPPKNDTCDQALDATAGLWVPQTTFGASDDFDPPVPCLKSDLGFSGPEVVFRVSPTDHTFYRVQVHPAAAFDPMISVLDGCQDGAQCLASGQAAGVGQDEELTILAPGGRDTFVVVEGERGEAGWWSLTVIRLDPDGAR